MRPVHILLLSIHYWCIGAARHRRNAGKREPAAVCTLRTTGNERTHCTREPRQIPPAVPIEATRTSAMQAHVDAQPRNRTARHLSPVLAPNYQGRPASPLIDAARWRGAAGVSHARWAGGRGHGSQPRMPGGGALAAAGVKGPHEVELRACARRASRK